MQLCLQLLLVSLAIAETCERRCPLGQHWTPGQDYCRYDQQGQIYCSCEEYVSVDGSTCLPCSEGPFDAHHASRYCPAFGAPPLPLPGPVTLACDAFSLRFSSDSSGEDHLLVTSTGGMTNLLGGGTTSEGGYFVRFSFPASGSSENWAAGNRKVAKNVTFSQGAGTIGTITITSSNDEYAVTLNVTSRGEYIKFELGASRGFSPNFWEPGQLDFEMELMVDVGLDGVEASWADAGQASIPALVGPLGAVGLLPLDFLVDCQVSDAGLRARWTGGLLGSAGPHGAVALAAAGSTESFGRAVAAVQGGEALSLPGARPSGGGLWLAPTSLPEDHESLRRTLLATGARGLRLAAPTEVPEVQPFEVQVEVATPLACLQPQSALLEAALVSGSLESLGTGTLAAPLDPASTEALLTPDAAAAGLFSAIANASANIDGFTELRQLQVGAEILGIVGLEAAGEAWRVAIGPRGLLGTSPAAAAVGSTVRLLLFHDSRPLLRPDSSTWQEAVQDWAKDAVPGTTILGTGQMCTGALGRRGWVQRKLLHDAAAATGSLRLAGQLGKSFAYYTGAPLKTGAVRQLTSTDRRAVEAELAVASPLHLEGYDWLHAYELGAFHVTQDSPTGSTRATSSDEVEWLMAKMLALGGALELRGQPQVLETSQALLSASLWAEAARNAWLPKPLRQVLAVKCQASSLCSPDGFYHLAGVFSDSGLLQAVRFWPMHRQVSFAPADGSAMGVLRNPWHLQPLRFELRVLPTFDLQQRKPLLPAQLALVGSSYNTSELAITGGDFSFRFEALVDLAGRLSKATWALPSGLLDFTQVEAGYSGILMNVTGNGLGGLLLLELSAGEGRTPLRFAVENNFIGRREVLLTSHEESEEQFASELQLLGLQPLLEDADLRISRVSVGLLGAGAQAAVHVENAVAVQNVLSPLANPTVRVKHKTTGEVLSTMTVSGCIPPRQYLVYEGGETAQLLDEQRQPRAELALSGALVQGPGDFVVGVEAASDATCGAGGELPRLRAVWRSLGEEAIFDAGTTDQARATQTSTSSSIPVTSKGTDMTESLLVGVQFQVEGLDFLQLVADSALLGQFKQVVRGSLLGAAVRANRSAEDLVLQLSPGSVVVQARMAAVATAGETVVAATSSLADGMREEASALQRDLIVGLAGIQGLSSVASSAISVGPVSVSLLAVEESEATPSTPTVQDFIPLWAIIALSLLTCFTMIVGLTAVYMQRRWVQERRRHSANWSEGSDPVHMTRRVRSRAPGSPASPQTSAPESPEAPKKSTSRMLMTKRAMRKVRFSDAEAAEVQEYDPRELQIAAEVSSQRNEELEAKVAELEAALKTVQGTLCVTEDRLMEVSKERDQLSLSVNGSLGKNTLLHRKGLFVSPRQGLARSPSGTRRSLGILDAEQEPPTSQGLKDLEAGDLDGLPRPSQVALDAESVRSDPRSEFSLCWAAHTTAVTTETMVSADVDHLEDDLQVTRV